MTRLLEQMELQLEELQATSPSSASGRRANRSPTICPASVSSSPHLRAVPAADHRSCRSWAKMSPRHWRSFLAVEGDSDSAREVLRAGTARRSPSRRRVTRRTPIAATTSCTTPRARRDQSRPPYVGRTPEGSSLSSRISRPMLGAARRRWQSRRLRSKRLSASTHFSTLNAASMAKVPKNGCGSARSRARLCWRDWKRARAAFWPFEFGLSRRTDRLHAAPLGSICPLHR